MGHKVLLVDDDQDFLTLMCFELQRHGFEVSTAVDGADGMQKFIEGSPDLLLLDVKMPNVAGEEMIRRVREKDKKTPIVVYSGYIESDAFERKLLDIGADKVLPKSIARGDLLQELDALLES